MLDIKNDLLLTYCTPFYYQLDVWGGAALETVSVLMERSVRSTAAIFDSSKWRIKIFVSYQAMVALK